MRHIEALADRFIEEGHHVRVFAPYDPPDRLAARLHKGARPQDRALPDFVVPLGRTVGFPANGAVSNLAFTPSSVSTLRRELAAGDFDVVHVHEPVAPTVGATGSCTWTTSKLPAASSRRSVDTDDGV